MAKNKSNAVRKEEAVEIETAVQVPSVEVTEPQIVPPTIESTASTEESGRKSTVTMSMEEWETAQKENNVKNISQAIRYLDSQGYSRGAISKSSGSATSMFATFW